VKNREAICDSPPRAAANDGKNVAEFPGESM
jgi:hypothetical protein